MGSKKSEGALILIAIILAIVSEFWPYILLVSILGGAFYFYNKQLVEKEDERKLKALTISNIDNMEGIEFEHYVSKLLRNEGYSTEVTKASNDYGVDIIAKKGIDKHSVQVKRYSKSVSRRAVSDAVAGMHIYNCNKSMVITNSYFSQGAKELAKSTSCILIDRDTLTKWIIKYQNPT